MPQESPYQLENIGYSAKLGLWVLVAAHDITTSNLPVAGVTTLTATGTNGLKLPTAGRPHSTYDNYIYTHLSPAATAGYFRLNFVDVFPTTPLVMEDIDPIWGKVRTHTYVALSGSAIPDIAAEWITGRYVLRVGEQQLSGDVCIVTVTTVGALTVSHTDKPVDEETGIAYTRTRTWTLATASPSAVATDSNGQFSEVAQQSHNLYLTTTSKVPGTMNLAANKRTWTEDTNAPFIWPAVLINFSTQQAVINPAETEDVDTLATYSIKNAYSGPVKCEVEEWWQLASHTAVGNDQMQPQAISVEGLRYPVNIPPCLTAGFSYAKRIFSVSAAAWQTMTVAVAATSDGDWPPTVVTYNVRPRSGGYLVEKRTWYKPTGYTGGTTVTIS